MELYLILCAIICILLWDSYSTHRALHDLERDLKQSKMHLSAAIASTFASINHTLFAADILNDRALIECDMNIQDYIAGCYKVLDPHHADLIKLIPIPDKEIISSWAPYVNKVPTDSDAQL